LGVSCGAPTISGGRSVKKPALGYLKIFFNFLISRACLGKVIIASAGIETVTNTLLPVCVTAKGVHVANAAETGTTGFGVTGGTFFSHGFCTVVHEACAVIQGVNLVPGGIGTDGIRTQE